MTLFSGLDGRWRFVNFNKDLVLLSLENIYLYSMYRLAFLK